MYALKMLGVVRAIDVSTASMESLTGDLSPGDVVIPNQYVDYTRKRQDTFFGDGLIAHLPMTDPSSPSLSSDIFEAASKHKIDVNLNRTLICVAGPRFPTHAENESFTKIGGDLVGMSSIPEVFLAREAQMAYATLVSWSEPLSKAPKP